MSPPAAHSQTLDGVVARAPAGAHDLRGVPGYRPHAPLAALLARPTPGLLLGALVLAVVLLLGWL